MDTNKIADLLAKVESLLATLRETEQSERMAIGWRILSHITQIYGAVNSSNVRAPGQLLVAKLIRQEAERLIKQTEISIPAIPEEFYIMINSIKSTGSENDLEKTG